MTGLVQTIEITPDHEVQPLSTCLDRKQKVHSAVPEGAAVMVLIPRGRELLTGGILSTSPALSPHSQVLMESARTLSLWRGQCLDSSFTNPWEPLMLCQLPVTGKQSKLVIWFQAREHIQLLTCAAGKETVIDPALWAALQELGFVPCISHRDPEPVVAVANMPWVATKGCEAPAFADVEDSPSFSLHL